MTDLITKLAEQLHALIQSSPRSPTKEEIAAVLRASDAVRPSSDAACAIDHPDTKSGEHKWYPCSDVPSESDRCLCGATRPARAQVDKQFNAIFADVFERPAIPREDQQAGTEPALAIMPLPYKPVSTAMEARRIAMDAGMMGRYPGSITNVPSEIRRRSEKSSLPCEFGLWPDHDHHWTPTGYDVNGLLCQAGSAIDVSNGKHWTCLNTCGASKLA